MKHIFYIAVLFLSSTGLFAQQIIINEVMTKNQSTIYDENENTPDWIELYNASNETVNLLDYSLVDRRSGKERWFFTDYELMPNSYIVVFASGKDRRTITTDWRTIINEGAMWKYHVGNSSVPADWNEYEFNDENWSSGRSGFGYGDNDDATVVSNAVSIYVRKEFELSELQKLSSAVLHVDFDDGFVAYLNGTEIARFNMGDAGSTVSYNTYANSNHEAQLYNGGIPEGFPVENALDLLKQGENVLALEVHNVSSSSSDMSLIPFFTLGFTESSDVGEPTPDFINLPSTLFHTDFSLSAAGENLYLFNPDSLITDSIVIPELSPDISFGRSQTDHDSLFFFLKPTPGEPNNYEGFHEKTGQPRSSAESGFYTPSLEVEINTVDTDSNSVIYFTLDGSIPSSSSQVYNDPLHIGSTAVLRMIAQKPGALPSNVISYTYIIDSDTKLPVISIITDPPNLWDYYEGIYVLGPNAESSNPHFGANYWQDWEKEARIQFFETDRSLAIDMNAGIKIYGAWSRAWDMKSLAVFARKKYGEEHLEHGIFPELPYDEYSSVILRNSGNDWNITMFRDAFMQVLVEDLNLDEQAYRPAVVYLNGEYWGIHNIREKINEEYLAQHYNVDADEVDILETNASIVEGSNRDYLDLINFIETHNLSVQQYYEEAEKKIDIDNFIDYQTSQIFFDNTDWPGNNIKYWRPQSDDGRWRWILYDTDFGFGIWNTNNYNNNTLEFALEEHGPDWPNPPWATFLLRSLLKNNEFKNKFINRFADLCNTVFASPNIDRIADSLANQVDGEIRNHISKWQAFSYNGWRNNVDEMKIFGKYRIPALRNYYRKDFGISGLYNLGININNTEGGAVQINSIRENDANWLGVYFKGVEITLTAMPNHGYKFVGWYTDNEYTEYSITLTPESNTVINAVFEKDDYINSIVINEINYNSAPDYDTEDWIELYNCNEIDFNLSGWILSDGDSSTQFTVPQRTVIKSGEYIVFTRDSTSFDSVVTDDVRIIGNLGFALSNSGDQVKLYDYNNILIDSINYNDSYPWPDSADGTGRTLSLINPELDNTVPENWQASGGYGTPGRLNDNYITGIDEDPVVAEFSLGQNYPNPFNPATIIEYAIPVVGTGRDLSLLTVKLVVYDILGREVATLVNRIQQPGKYKIEFDGSNLSSGLYLYRLVAGESTSVRKMLLLK